MRVLVALQVLLAHKLLAAGGAGQHLLLLVHELDMFGEARSPAKRRPALFAVEAALARVVEHVRAQLGSLDEGLVADCALVGLFTCGLGRGER